MSKTSIIEHVRGMMKGERGTHKMLPAIPAVKLPQTNVRPFARSVMIDARERPANDAPMHHFLLYGCTLHAQALDSFVEVDDIGYYAHEKRTEWRTCAVAALYAGVYGRNVIERRHANGTPIFSYDECAVLLASFFDIDISHMHKMLKGMQALNDSGWARESIAMVLRAHGL